jgi:hypothetical protein
MTVTRVEFIQQKARNMRDWLRPHLSYADLQQYDESRVMDVVATVLFPLHTAGKLDEAVEELFKRLQHVPSDKQQAYKVKIKRYFACFCEALQAS